MDSLFKVLLAHFDAFLDVSFFILQQLLKAYSAHGLHPGVADDDVYVSAAVPVQFLSNFVEVDISLKLLILEFDLQYSLPAHLFWQRKVNALLKPPNHGLVQVPRVVCGSKHEHLLVNATFRADTLHLGEDLLPEPRANWILRVGRPGGHDGIDLI